ncbi:MAG: AAA family ATPase [Butyrivibrio sp.]|nr:AAA family ATPase [Butyrivibrio sp.]
MKTVQYDYFIEEQVINKLNDTNLEYIGIFGLFGRYDIEIPFDKQVNIFIGENGMGKTTILNCIYFILEKNFSRLMNIQFSEIKVKFKDDSKMHAISPADIRAYYNGDNRKDSYKYMNYVPYHNDIVSFYLRNIDDEILIESKSDMATDRLIHEIAGRMNLPTGYVKDVVSQYAKNRENNDSNRREANRKNVVQLINAISKQVKQRVVYLPTYRRIEDDLTSLNLQSEELNRAELLIRFGMSDVQTSINIILAKIRSLAMEGFTKMTGVLLKQYADGIDLEEEMYNIRKKYLDVSEETVKIVLDRVGNEIDPSYKEKISHLIDSGDIWNYNYFHLLNLITKLIENYDIQKSYDDRITKFTNTCNKYLNGKQFHYNKSTLDLNIYLDNEKDENKRVISLTQLSSGEKQIVSLFSKLYLESNEKSIVIIDEPELSLSLPWQKMLLPDIMRTENCDLLLTVTHSPFIFQNEFDADAKDMSNYITLYEKDW